MYKILFPVIAGFFITLQGVFTARVADKVGLWESNVIVHSMGLFLTLILLYFLGDGNFKNINEVKPLYLLGGFFGSIIIFTVAKSFLSLSPTFAVAILLITQLVIATIIDCNGLFGVEPVNFDVRKFIGITMMIIGIIIFKIKI